MTIEIIRLGDVAEINPRRPQIDLINADLVTFVPMESVDETTGEITTARPRPFGEVKKGYTVFTDGDVIFAKVTPCMQNGKHAIAHDLLNGLGFGSTEFHVVRPGPRILSAWVHYFLRRQETLDAAKKKINGAVGLQRVPSSFLTDVELLLPDVNTQRRITKNLKLQLAAAEEARQAAQSQLNEIRLLKTQALKAVFATIEDSAPLGDVARIQSGYAFKSETFQKHGVRLLRNANIAPGRVHWDDAVFIIPSAAEAHAAYALAEGDVLISLDRPIIKTGIKVTRVTATDLPALLVQRVGRFRIDETRLNADYLYAFLHTEPFVEAISGHEQSLGVPHISPGQIEAIDIPLPTLPEQQRLAVILNNIAEATHEAQSAAELQLRDIELLPSRLLAAVFDAPATAPSDDA
jgi:type I restriction enzyme S subunit